MKVLIGEISSYKAIVIARHLRKTYSDVYLMAYDRKKAICFCHTKYVDECIFIEHKDTDTYIYKLAECVRDNGVDVFIPVHSDYIGEILLHKEWFGHSLDYLGVFSDYVQLHEKDQLMSIAKESGVHVPIQFDSIERAKVPFVLKPTNKSSAKGVRYCMQESDKQKLKSKVDKSDSRMIYQEYVVGIGCGYSVFCKNGRIIQEYGHMRLAEYPTSGGSSVYRKGYVHPSMRTTAEKILSRVAWTGFVMFEFKLTPTNELILIEVNPRIWGSINQALQDGIPFFSAIFGRDAVRIAQPSDSKVRTCLSPQVFLSFLIYALKGDVSQLVDFLTYRSFVSKDVSFWNDPKGFTSMMLRKL